MQRMSESHNTSHKGQFFWDLNLFFQFVDATIWHEFCSSGSKRIFISSNKLYSGEEEIMSFTAKPSSSSSSSTSNAIAAEYGSSLTLKNCTDSEVENCQTEVRARHHMGLVKIKNVEILGLIRVICNEKGFSSSSRSFFAFVGTKRGHFVRSRTVHQDLLSISNSFWRYFHLFWRMFIFEHPRTERSTKYLFFCERDTKTISSCLIAEKSEKLPKLNFY